MKGDKRPSMKSVLVLTFFRPCCLWHCCFRDQLEEMMEKQQYNDAQQEVALQKAQDVQQAKRCVTSVVALLEQALW